MPEVNSRLETASLRKPIGPDALTKHGIPASGECKAEQAYEDKSDEPDCARAHHVNNCTLRCLR